MKNLLKLIIVVLTLFLSNLVMSQSGANYNIDSLLISTEKNKTLGTYYSKIYEAERLIVKENFDKAAEVYFEAFKYIEKPFLVDLYHALDCELLSLSTRMDNVKFLVKALMQKHGDKTIFENDELYKSLLTIPVVNDIVNSTKIIVDTLFANQIEMCLNIDQDIRHESSAAFNGQIYNDTYKDTIQYIDSVNYFQLIDLINKYGYISEELIGTGWYGIFVVINHNRQRNEIFPVLHKSVISGKLDARLFAAVLEACDYMFDSKYHLTENGILLNGEVFNTDKLDKKTISKIDEIRKCIYLEDLNERLDKIAWIFRNPNYYFVFASNIFDLYLPDDEFYSLVLDYAKGEESKIMLYFKSDEQELELLRKAKEWEHQNVEK